jgi:hypothetical protein
MSRVDVEQIRRRLRKKSALLVSFMNSEVGKAVVKALEDEFYHGNLFDPDPYVSAYNMGRRDVVVYLHQLQRYGENDNADGTS